MKWRFATLNTWKNDGNYHARIPLIASQAQELHPDFLFLQEVFSTLDGDIHTAIDVSIHLQQKQNTQTARIKLRSINQQSVISSSGLALITHHKPSNQGGITLPSNEKDGGRKAQFAHLLLANTRLAVLNLHLSHLPNNDALKIEQLQTALAHPAIKNEPNILIIGDLNSTPDSLTYRFLTEQRFVSSFKALNKEYVPTLLSTSQKPNKTLDYIMLRSSNLRFDQTGITFNQPNSENLFPSDHLGVWADIVPVS